MKQYSVGLVGVGAVGTEMIKVLKERNFPLKGAVQVFASRERDEQILGETYHVKKADENSFNGLDIVLFAGKTDVAIQLKDAVVKAGAKMIDNSRAFRQDPEVPLVVPQVNAEDLDWNKGVIANPNCTTAIMLEAVAPLHKAKGLKRVVAATYQAASGAGQPGLNELEDQIRAYAKGEPLEVKAFQHQLMYNLIPHIDKFNEENWYTLEELKMLNESRKMLHHPTLKLSCTCVRVPIARAHSESLNLEFENDITPLSGFAFGTVFLEKYVFATPIHSGAWAMMLSLILVPIISTFTKKQSAERIEEIFDCYKKTVTVKATDALKLEEDN